MDYVNDFFAKISKFQKGINKKTDFINEGQTTK